MISVYLFELSVYHTVSADVCCGIIVKKKHHNTQSILTLVIFDKLYCVGYNDIATYMIRVYMRFISWLCRSFFSLLFRLNYRISFTLRS